MADQAGSIPGSVIAFVSAKGGTGKTIMAVTTANRLLRAGKRVLLVDADFGTRGMTVYLHRILGDRYLSYAPASGMYEMLENRTAPTALNAREFPLHSLKFHFVPASLGPSPSELSVAPTQYYEFLNVLCEHCRKKYDYTIVDTRGGYDYTSAAPAVCADFYVVVLEADGVSIEQVHGLVQKINEFASVHGARPVLGGFIVNKALFSVEDSLFANELAVRYEARHFGTLPLDPTVVRAMQRKELPIESEPESDYSYHSSRAVERMIAPELNWEPKDALAFARDAQFISSLWTVRRRWERLRKSYPALIIVLSLLTAAFYLWYRASESGAGLATVFYSAAIFFLVSTLTSSLLLLSTMREWRVSRPVRFALSTIAISTACGVFYLAAFDAPRTLSSNGLQQQVGEARQNSAHWRALYEAAQIQVKSLTADLVNAQGTRLAGFFPDNVPVITALISRAHENLVIATDFAAYGEYSSPIAFLKYLETIKNLVKRRVHVTIFVYGKELATKVVQQQFAGDVASYGGASAAFTAIQSTKAFPTYVKTFGLRTPRDLSDFYALLEEREQHFRADLVSAGANVREISQDLPVYMWISDENRAVISIRKTIGDYQEMSLVVEDASLVEKLNQIVRDFAIESRPYSRAAK